MRCVGEAIWQHCRSGPPPPNAELGWVFLASPNPINACVRMYFIGRNSREAEMSREAVTQGGRELSGGISFAGKERRRWRELALCEGFTLGRSEDLVLFMLLHTYAYYMHIQYI